MRTRYRGTFFHSCGILVDALLLWYVSMLFTYVQNNFDSGERKAGMLVLP